MTEFKVFVFSYWGGFWTGAATVVAAKLFWNKIASFLGPKISGYIVAAAQKAQDAANKVP